MIFLAQQVQGGGCSYHSPPSSPASYGYTNVTKPNRGSNRLWIKISEQRKKSRLILQSGMYIFCVTNNISKAEHGLSSSESTYKWLGQAKTLQNSVNKYKWTEGITFHLFFCAVGNFFFKFFFSFSFRQWRCLIWKLNSKGNLTRKQLNFELFAEGGVPVFVLQIYPNSNCDISGHIWDIAKLFSALNSLLSDLWEKIKKFGRFKSLKLT